ncbi:manganese-dependent inorganic pyrophosphatase, partial [Pseudoalteromonas sp. S3173]
VVGVVDHNKLCYLTSSTPLEFWILPVVCSNTIIKMLYEFYKVEIPKDITSFKLCAKLSDTVIFKKATFTTADIKFFESIAEIAD